MKISKHSEKLAAKHAGQIPLIEIVKKICLRLEKHGWGDLLRKHGLDLTAPDLKNELLKPLEKIDRNVQGFQDFALEGFRGIEPGRPAQSLLFHAFASSQVIAGVDGVILGEFPTPLEIETIENLVYGIKPPSIQELRIRGGNVPLAVVVFASEYRPAISNVHQKHADVCFSRVGVTRVGTASCKYLSQARGYTPLDEKNPFNIRVTPCRYSAYVSALLPGNEENFGPLRFQKDHEPDSERKFWVPIHKLFSGPECIRGMSLSIAFTAHHLNEKLKRVHQEISGMGYDTGRHNPDINESPFSFQEGIAEFSNEENNGQGLLVPIVHKSLVELAMYKGKPLTYKVPADFTLYKSSINIKGKQDGGRAAPEYVHVRHRLEKDDSITDLNNNPDMIEIIKDGGYEALHYLDYTGDGYIQVECPELALEIPKMLAAYSLVSPVDFFPFVKQTELMQWWNQSVPDQLVENIWPTNPGSPKALSDIRYPPNLSLTFKKLNLENNPQTVFDPMDRTMCAIVGLINSAGGQLTQIDDLVNERVTTLPDGAAGVFAPGWDTSIDRTGEYEQDNGTIAPGVSHFNNYGLGSPFPEDAMLCAALSSFWPAAAPDITRTFAPGNYATATPLTDEILGLTGEEPWDGIHGPIIPDPSKKEVEYRNISYGDYVDVALKGKFNFEKIAKTTVAEYAAQTLVMARVYASLGAVTREQKVQWAIFSFLLIPEQDEERKKAEVETGARLNPVFAYRFIMYKHKPVAPERKPEDHRNVFVGYEKMLTIFADPKTVLIQDDNGKWIARHY